MILKKMINVRDLYGKYLIRKLIYIKYVGQLHHYLMKSMKNGENFLMNSYLIVNNEPTLMILDLNQIVYHMPSYKWISQRTIPSENL